MMNGNELRMGFHANSDILKISFVTVIFEIMIGV